MSDPLESARAKISDAERPERDGRLVHAVWLTREEWDVWRPANPDDRRAIILEPWLQPRP